MAAYSFLNFAATISGPGGSANLGVGAGAAEEGITFGMLEEKDLMIVGAGGELMHVLRASNAGKCTVRLLKTSPVNAVLSQMFNFQKGNPAIWGSNVLTAADVARGDVASITQAAFLKQPDVTWDRDGKMIEWEFVGLVEEQLGSGAPDANLQQ